VTHEQASELLAAFALHALDRDEARAVSAHVRSCAECQRELASLQRVAEQLGSAARQVSPPQGLREAVLAGIQVRQDTILLRRGWAVGLSAAAALLLILLAGLGVSLSRQLTALSTRLAAQEQVLALLSSPSARSVPLSGSVTAAARFVYDPNRGRGALVVSDLRDPGREFVYQLWLIAGTQPESAGVFRPAPGQSVVFPLAADFSRYQAVAISVERAPSGAPQPTTTPILIGNL
jgi:anti-sigma-K factor RskA/putative zinc finger protein